MGDHTFAKAIAATKEAAKVVKDPPKVHLSGSVIYE